MKARLYWSGVISGAAIFLGGLLYRADLHSQKALAPLQTAAVEARAYSGEGNSDFFQRQRQYVQMCDWKPTGTEVSSGLMDTLKEMELDYADVTDPKVFKYVCRDVDELMGRTYQTQTKGTSSAVFMTLGASFALASVACGWIDPEAN